MRNLGQQLLKHAAGQPEGTPLSAKAFLHWGSRAAVDQALSRLARAGQLMRAGRGLYMSPVQSRFGTRAPSVEKAMAEVARFRGETITPSGAASANALGLSNQVPVQMVYLTSGPSRRMKMGAQTVELRHAPRWQLGQCTEAAGQAIRALAWLGPEQAREGLSALKSRLPKSVLEEIAAARGSYPAWLAQAVGSELVANG